MSKQELLSLNGVTLRYSEKLRDFSIRKKPKYMTAVDNLNLIIYKGESLGLVGESGCGKSSTGKMILRLAQPSEGTITFAGQDIFSPAMKDNPMYYTRVQMIFQDPYSSLDPRFQVGRTIMEPMTLWGIGTPEERRARAIELMEVVGLKEEQFERYPFEFSGGQRQRIGIARALCLNPELIVCDEPVSALDVSIQAQILNLMQDLQAKYNLTYLFISHNLSVVKHFCTRIAVMYMGQLVEMADNEELFRNPKHPYTMALLSAVLEPDPNVKMKRNLIQGELPSPFNLPPGCKFQTRCPYVMDICREKDPAYYAENAKHIVKCHYKGI